MKISLIVATFGNPEWMEIRKRAIRSVEHQGFYQWVISHDGTNVCQSRNLAAQDASGDWLCFLDGDDELAPNFCGAMTRALEQQKGSDGNHDRLLLTPAVQAVHGNRRRSAARFWPGADLTQSNFLPIGTLISRTLFWEIGGFDEQDLHGLEDFSLWTRAYRAGGTVVRVPDAVYVQHWRRGMSHQLFQRDMDAYMAEWRRIHKQVWPERWVEA